VPFTRHRYVAWSAVALPVWFSCWRSRDHRASAECFLYRLPAMRPCARRVLATNQQIRAQCQLSDSVHPAARPLAGANFCNMPARPRPAQSVQPGCRSSKPDASRVQSSLRTNRAVTRKNTRSHHRIEVELSDDMLTVVFGLGGDVPFVPAVLQILSPPQVFALGLPIAALTVSRNHPGTGRLDRAGVGPVGWTDWRGRGSVGEAEEPRCML
jgi:hypothetical protein